MVNENATQPIGGTIPPFWQIVNFIGRLANLCLLGVGVVHVGRKAR